MTGIIIRGVIAALVSVIIWISFPWWLIPPAICLVWCFVWPEPEEED